MQRKLTSRRTFRMSLLLACLGLAMSGLANAQVSITSPETDHVRGRAPVLATATITGTGSGPTGQFLTGDTLTANYTLTDPDNDAEDQTATRLTIQWTSGGTPVGTPGSMTYTIQASDAGRAITYSLVPTTDVNTTDPHEGARTLASNVGSDGSGGGGGPGDEGGGGGVTPAADNLLLSVAITGNPLVSDTLTAVPTCTATCTGNITYQWQLETAFGSGNYADVAGQTGATFTPANDHQKRKVQVVANQPAL